MTIRKSNITVKIGLSLLLALVLALLMYTSLILPRNLIAIHADASKQQPCDNRLLQSREQKLQVKNEGALVKIKAGAPSLGQQDNVDSNMEQISKKEIMELQHELGQVREELQSLKRTSRQPPIVIDRADDGLRPLRVTVAHHPRSDLLGSFCMPSVLLLAITHKYGWEMELLPYNQSFGQRWLTSAFAQGSKLGAHAKGYGTGFQDANYRKDYNPADLNAQAYANLGFFPEQPFPVANTSEWTEVKPLPAPGSASLHKACRKNPIVEANGHVKCRLILPRGDDTGPLLKHILAHGTLEEFLTPELCKLMHDRFMQQNSHRLKYYNSTSDFHVAIHVRRGEINKKDFPDRWTEQSVYASIARHVCKQHPSANIHVFSSGKNEEGWATLEQIVDTCAKVSFHLDLNEFDAWAHFVAADVLVTSRSTFSYVPALFASGQVFAPEWGHAPLSRWHSFRNEDGKLKPPSNTTI